jgi:hypothetical protein
LENVWERQMPVEELVLLGQGPDRVTEGRRHVRVALDCAEGFLGDLNSRLGRRSRPNVASWVRSQ